MSTKPGQLQFAETLSLMPRLYLGRAEDAFEGMERFAPDYGLEIGGYIQSQQLLIKAHLGMSEEVKEYLANPELGPESIPSAISIMSLQSALYIKDWETASRFGIGLSSLSDGLGLQPQVVIARLLGSAKAGIGDINDAREYFYKAIDIGSRVRHRPEIALTRLQLAELLLEHYPDERAEAMGHLDFAIGEFKDMKM